MNSLPTAKNRPARSQRSRALAGLLVYWVCGAAISLWILSHDSSSEDAKLTVLGAFMLVGLPLAVVAGLRGRKSEFLNRFGVVFLVFGVPVLFYSVFAGSGSWVNIALICVGLASTVVGATLEEAES